MAWARCEAIGSGGGCGERDRERPVHRAGGSSALADCCHVGMERPSLAGRTALTSQGDRRSYMGVCIRGTRRTAGRQSRSYLLWDVSWFFCRVDLVLCMAVTASNVPHAVLISFFSERCRYWLALATTVSCHPQPQCVTTATIYSCDVVDWLGLGRRGWAEVSLMLLGPVG